MTITKLNDMKKYKLIKEYPFCNYSNGDIITVDESEKTKIDIYSFYSEFWQEVKEPLFVADDNVPIYEGEDYWIVANDLAGFWKTDSNAYEKRKDSLFFSSREAAEKWIEQNKPVFSRKQILDAIAKNTSGMPHITENISFMIYRDSFKKELGL